MAKIFYSFSILSEFKKNDDNENIDENSKLQDSSVGIINLPWEVKFIDVPNLLKNNLITTQLRLRLFNEQGSVINKEDFNPTQKISGVISNVNYNDIYNVDVTYNSTLKINYKLTPSLLTIAIRQDLEQSIAKDNFAIIDGLTWVNNSGNIVSPPLNYEVPITIRGKFTDRDGHSYSGFYGPGNGSGLIKLTNDTQYPLYIDLTNVPKNYGLTLPGDGMIYAQTIDVIILEYLSSDSSAMTSKVPIENKNSVHSWKFKNGILNINLIKI